MFRRKFIARLSLTSATALGVVGVIHAGQSKTVTYRVKGFTCITCAVGLDTMLSQQKGVLRSKSSYPDATTTIEFDPRLVAEQSLKDFILEMGFRAEEARLGGKPANKNSDPP